MRCQIHNNNILRFMVNSTNKTNKKLFSYWHMVEKTLTICKKVKKVLFLLRKWYIICKV